MSTFRELYMPYVDYFRHGLGQGWWNATDVAKSVGGSAGIYPDIGMLLDKLVARDDIQTVMEIGSGFSTWVLATACKRYGKKLISLEQSTDQAALTRKFLEAIGVDQEVFLTRGALPKISKKKGQGKEITIELARDEVLTLDDAPDLIFYNCEAETRGTFIKKALSLFRGAKLVIVDDMEHPTFFTPVMEALFSAGKKNCCFFNPTGRQDQVVLLATRDKEEDLNRWVWDWRPDKVFW